MGQNSIHSNISKEDIMADIRMTLGADFERKKSVIVVEGSDDVRFFCGKLGCESELYESYSGKQGVLEIAEYFSDARVIGICDSDYDASSGYNNVFFYDNNCLEMMLIEDDSAFSSVFYVYYQGNDTPLEMRLRLLDNLKWLSNFRKLNSQNGWGGNVRGIRLSKAINEQYGTLDQEKLKEEIEEHNPSWGDKAIDYFEQVEEECQEEYSEEDFYRITQGHDFLNYFQSICNTSQKIRSKMPSTDEILHGLICAYSMNSFRATELSQSLVNYQNKHSVRILTA